MIQYPKCPPKFIKAAIIDAFSIQYEKNMCVTLNLFRSLSCISVDDYKVSDHSNMSFVYLTIEMD